jgi:phosphoribosylamine--glycine ligase
MGAYSPTPSLTPALQARVMTEIISPTLETLARRGTPFVGILYAGLMLTSEGPKLIEYNVRLGDPECQVLMPRLRSDLLEGDAGALRGPLGRPRSGMVGSRGARRRARGARLSGQSRRRSEIRGVGQAEALDDVFVFHAGAAIDGQRLVAQGGRVLCVTASVRASRTPRSVPIRESS